MAQARKSRSRAVDVTKESGNKLPARIIKATPANFVQPPEVDQDAIETPKGITDDFELEEAPGGMVTTVEFSQPGAFVFGKYKGTRSLNIGNRVQLLHDLDVDGTIRALWGSTILDQRIMRLNPQLDEWVYIQYVGDVDTSRKLNPAKNFRVARMKERPAKR